MSTQAFIGQSDMLGLSVNIGFMSVWDGHYTARKPGLGTACDEVRQLRDGEEFPPEYVLRLSTEDARALLEALVRHFNGAQDTRALRKDYDAERQRVDRFIAYLTERSA